ILEKQLLRHKNNEGNTALHLALRNRHKNLAMSLFEKDTEVTHYQNYEDKSPLHMAAEVGYSELFGLMAETLLPIPNNDIHRQEIEKYVCRLVRVVICRKNNGTF
ncbi:Protein accelerated cell death, partial [Trema orientale]